MPAYEACGAARDVHVFPDEIAVDPCEEILRIEIDVLHVRIQLRRNVIPQPLRIHSELEIAERVDPRAARFRHLVARDGDETVHVDVVRRLVAGVLEHGRPEQGVEVDDVLADEVDHLGAAAGLHEGVEVDPPAVAVVLQAREVSDRGVEPDVQVFLFLDTGNPDSEIRRVARDVPVGERLVAFALEPLFRFVRHLWLEPAGLVGPLAQEFLAFRIGELEEVVLRRLQYRFRAGERRIRILQLRGRIDGAAIFAGVSVLILRSAVRALALDVAIGEEHAFHRIEELRYRFLVDESRLVELAVDVLRELGIFFRVSRVPVVERDVEPVEVLLAPLCDFRDELLRRLPRLFRSEHDRGAVRVVGTDEVHFVALHALEPHPDVRLDVFHDVADVERAVRVRQGGGDEQPAAHADFQKPSFYRLAPESGALLVGVQTRAITVAMTTATPTVAAMITFSRWPQGRSPGRRARSRDIDVAEMDFVETNSVVPSAPI